MIDNDSLENYIFIRNKLFRINQGIEGVGPKPALHNWKKETLAQDFDAKAINEIAVYENPIDLPVEVKNMYLEFLERELLHWSKLL